MTQVPEKEKMQQVENEVKKYLNERLYEMGYITEKMYKTVKRLLMQS